VAIEVTKIEIKIVRVKDGQWEYHVTFGDEVREGTCINFGFASRGVHEAVKEFEPQIQAAEDAARKAADDAPKKKSKKSEE
jgi:hypothetical protein